MIGKYLFAQYDRLQTRTEILYFKISEKEFPDQPMPSQDQIAQIYLHPLQSSHNCILKENTCKQRKLSSVCSAFAQPDPSLTLSSKVKQFNSMRKSVRNLARGVENLHPSLTNLAIKQQYK